MARFILRYQGPGAKPVADVARIRALSNLSVLDDSSPRMLLVEALDDAVQTLVATTPGWVLSREELVELPEPHPNLRKSKTRTPD